MPKYLSRLTRRNFLPILCGVVVLLTIYGVDEFLAESGALERALVSGSLSGLGVGLVNICNTLIRKSIISKK